MNTENPSRRFSYYGVVVYLSVGAFLGTWGCIIHERRCPNDAPASAAEFTADMAFWLPEVIGMSAAFSLFGSDLPRCRYGAAP